MPPKNIVKATKVTFQTTLGEPQTQGVSSPSRSSELEAGFALHGPQFKNCPHIWTQKENQVEAKQPIEFSRNQQWWTADLLAKDP